MTTSTTAPDAVWLRDTLARISVRYGRVLHALSLIPGPLALAHLWSDPQAADVQDSAPAMLERVQTAMNELGRIEDYVYAITEPLSATCGVCGAGLHMFIGRDGWQHWRSRTDAAPGELLTEIFEADHDPVVVWGDPDRPDWRADDADLTADNAPVRAEA
jgi:hypothetical protein